MKNFKKLALIAATAVVFSASAHADGQWGSDVVLKNLEKLGGTAAQFDGVAGVFQANETHTQAYLDQLNVVNNAQNALDAAAVTNSFGSADTFGSFAGTSGTDPAAPTIAELVGDITDALFLLDNTRATQVSTSGVVADLFAANGIFDVAIESKLGQFSAQATLIGAQITNLAKNIAKDLSGGGSLSTETTDEIAAIDAAIADVHD